MSSQSHFNGYGESCKHDNMVHCETKTLSIQNGLKLQERQQGNTMQKLPMRASLELREGEFRFRRRERDTG